jgi:hypothetical protein
MKKHFAITMLLVMSFTVIATHFAEFNGWHDLIERSPEIILAKRQSISETATNSDTSHPIMLQVTDSGVSYPIDVIYTLKGDSKPGPSELQSSYSFRTGVLPRQGDLFLVFANNLSGSNPPHFRAIEDYRIVIIAPDINASAWTNALAGKPLKEQINKILKYRLDTLNEELNRGQEEKKRLEAGLKEL